MRAPDPWTFALLALASYRLTRLVTRDRITACIRKRLRGDRVGYLLRCPWCAGFWISLLAYLAWAWQPRAALVPLTVFSLSAIVGLLTKNLDKEMVTSAASRD
jgi:hypothetical protein